MPFGIREYEPIVGKAVIEDLFALAEKPNIKTMQHINSTSVGGGVAEILNRMIPLFNELGIKTRWDVIRGGEDFFEVTKGYHNALHGTPTVISQSMHELYRKQTKENAETMNFDSDLIIIHDPQPAALIEYRGDKKSNWIWRCHIDVSKPQPDVWEFLSGFIKKYDSSIFSMEAYARKDLPVRQFMVPPSIDPLSEKNRDLSEDEVTKIIDKMGLELKKPLITQISRFDWLKDPLGVIQAYRLVKKQIDCQLVLAGGAATDDPESLKVLAAITKEAEVDKDIHILNLPPFSDKEINALQRASDVVVQKSIKEGFGLTVSEALWKARPVVASAVGGIPLQVINGVTGYLVHSIDGAALRIRQLLRHPELGKKMGNNGKEHVRLNFLLTRHLRDYLLVAVATKLDYEVIWL